MYGIFYGFGNEDYRPIELPVVFHVTVNKLEQSYNAGVINSTLTYDASEKNLASGGSADNGTFYYGISQSSTVEPSSWSENAPKAINAGSYYIWYKVVGNTNYKDVNPTYLGEAIIQKSSNLNVDFSNQSFLQHTIILK